MHSTEHSNSQDQPHVHPATSRTTNSLSHTRPHSGGADRAGKLKGARLLIKRLTPFVFLESRTDKLSLFYPSILDSSEPEENKRVRTLKKETRPFYLSPKTALSTAPIHGMVSGRAFSASNRQHLFRPVASICQQAVFGLGHHWVHCGSRRPMDLIRRGRRTDSKGCKQHDR